MIKEIDFEWSRAYAYVIESLENDPARRVIKQVGLRKDRIRPLELPSKTPLAVVFSKLDGSPEQCVAFAKAHGLLRTPAGQGPEPFDGPDGWPHSIKLMKAVINSTIAMVMPSPRWRRTHMPLAPLAKVNIGLVSGLPDPRPTLVLQPPTLWDAMIVQFAQVNASGNEMAICQACEEWFERGINGKRADARFCSRRCQTKFDYRKRRAGK
jgi:hypothetical protein